MCQVIVQLIKHLRTESSPDDVACVWMTAPASSSFCEKLSPALPAPAILLSWNNDPSTLSAKTALETRK